MEKIFRLLFHTFPGFKIKLKLYIFTFLVICVCLCAKTWIGATYTFSYPKEVKEENRKLNKNLANLT